MFGRCGDTLRQFFAHAFHQWHKGRAGTDCRLHDDERTDFLRQRGFSKAETVKRRGRRSPQLALRM